MNFLSIKIEKIININEYNSKSKTISERVPSNKKTCSPSSFYNDAGKKKLVNYWSVN